MSIERAFHTDLTAKNIQSLDKEILKYIQEQAEKKLKDSMEAGDAIRLRSYNFIAVASTLLIAASGFLLNNLIAGYHLTPLIYGFVIGMSVYLMIVLGLLGWNVMPKRYSGIGAEPERIFMKEFVEYPQSVDSDTQIKFIYASEIESYQNRIYRSVLRNRESGIRLKIAIGMLLLIPILVFTLLSLS